MIQLNEKIPIFATLFKGKVPEWSIGPHSKCGVRATVPGVRIPPFPLSCERQSFLSLFFVAECCFVKIFPRYTPQQIYSLCSPQLFEGGTSHLWGYLGRYNPHQTLFDCGAPSMMVCTIRIPPFPQNERSKEVLKKFDTSFLYPMLSNLFEEGWI